MTPAERVLAKALAWLDRQLAADGCHACGIGIHGEDDATVIGDDTYCQKCGPYAIERDIARRLRDRQIDIELSEMGDVK